MKTTATAWMRHLAVGLTACLAMVVAGGPAGAALLVHYDFDEAQTGTTTALDGGIAPAANGSFVNQATRVPRVVYTPSGVTQGALDVASGVAGQNHYVSGGNVPKLNGLTSLTITAWINSRVDDTGRIVDWSTSTTMGFQLNKYGIVDYAGGSKLGLAINNNYQYATANYNDFLEQWVFVAAVWNGSEVRFYVGGETPAASVTQLGGVLSLVAAATNTLASGQLRISSTSLTAADRTPTAWIDDVRIYDEALTALQLEAIRLTQVVPEPTSLALLGLAGVAALGRRR